MTSAIIDASLNYCGRMEIIISGVSEKVPSRDGILARMSKRYSLSKEEGKHITGRGNRKLITERYTHNTLGKMQIAGQG